MYTITYIDGTAIASISSPNRMTACTVCGSLRRLGLTVRMWHNGKTLLV